MVMLKRLRYQTILFVLALLLSGGCGQTDANGNFNPGGCDGPNKISVDAQP